PGAERRVRVRLVLDEVARREGLTLTEEEMSRAVENLAQESREDVQKMQGWLAQGDRLAGLREYLLRQKAMATLVAGMAGGGGSATAGLAIYDTMQYMRAPVSTICVGLAASAGAIILAGGTKGRRFALTYSRMMIHQPWGGAEGSVSDISIQTKEFLAIRQILNEVL